MTRGLPSLPPPVASYRDRVAPDTSSPSPGSPCFPLSKFNPDPTGATPSDAAFLAAVAEVAGTPTKCGTICVEPGVYLLHTTIDTSECLAITFRSVRSRYPYGASIYSDDLDLTMFKLGGFNNNIVTFDGLGFAHFNFAATETATGHILSSDDDEGVSASVYVLNCAFGGPGGYGGGALINLGWNASNVLVAGSQFITAYGDVVGPDASGQGAIVLHDFYGDRVRVIGNTFRACWPAVSSVGSSNFIDHLMIHDNQFFQQGTVPIAQIDIVGGLNQVSIAGNTFGGTRAMRILDPGNTCAYNISGNSGTVDVDLPAIDIETDFALVVGNSFFNRLDTPVATADGIRVKGDHNRITSNIFHNFRYGANVLAGATNTAVEGNTLSGTTGTLLDAGTGTTNVNNMA